MNMLLSFLSLFIIIIFPGGPVFSAEQPHEVKMGNIAGQLMMEAKGPMTGGTVFFFDEQSGPPPSSTNYWRVPTYAFRVDESGKFNVRLPEGRYYMGASLKLSGEMLGPPGDGDFFYTSRNEKGSPKIHEIRQGEIHDMGVISGAKPFSRKSLVTEGITSIKGTIRDAEGKPIEGMLVFAFSRPVMFGRPLFVSERSGKDGTYLLRLHSGGNYYLRARANYSGGPPSADQVIGVYKKGQPLSIATNETLEGIDITVTRIGIAD